MTMLPLEEASPLEGGPAPLIRPRPYQAEDLDVIAAKHAAGVTRQLAVLPTGTGKTVEFSHLIHRRRAAGRSVVLVHRDELIHQTVDKLAMVSGTRLGIGIVKAAQDDVGAVTVVASVQTLARPGRVERLLAAGPVATVVVDECHHSVSPTWLDVLARLGCLEEGGPLTVGFTATAMRTDKLALGTVWQEITVRRGLMRMIADGYLVDVHAQQIGSDFDLGNLQVRAGDFTDASIGEELERSDAFAAMVKGYRKYADGRLAVGFMPTVATAQMLAAAFTADGIAAEAVWGAMPIEERRAVLARLHTGETRVVANCAVLTEGWDEPAISCVLMGRPTKSEPFFTQMVGRGLRPFTGKVGGEVYEKTDLLVLDVTGATDLGLCTLATLAGLKPGSVKPGQSLTDAAEEADGEERRKVQVGLARTRQVELLRRAEMHWLDVEGSWVLPAGGGVVILIDAAADGAEDAWEVWKVGAAKGSVPHRIAERALTLEWARGVGEEFIRGLDTHVSRSDAAWRKRPISDGQRDQMRRRRVAIPDGCTRGQASDLLTAKFAARDIKVIRKGAGAGPR